MNKVCYYCGILNAGENMKVITEEEVNFICNVIDGVEDRLDDFDKRNIITLLRGHLEEIDTLTVTKLRPMVDAPVDDETILCVGDSYNTFLKVYFDGEYYKDDHNDIYDKEYFIGWVPMPIYKPEKE